MMEVIGIQLSTAVVRRSGAGNLTKGNEVFFDFSIWQNSKVENILKGILDLIPSPFPSVKIQIMVWKV